MGRLVDITGRRFGLLRVLRYDGLDGGKNAQWLCSCDCGELVTVRGYRLRSGETASCGCLRIDASTAAVVKRGDGSVGKTAEGRSLYSAWTAMRARCLNPDHPAFPAYGGRGITICDRWLEAFAKFAEDMGPKPFPGAELDRIDNDGPYAPENCRWASLKANSRNRRSVRMVATPLGRMPLWKAAEVSGLASGTLAARLARGCLPDRLFDPVRRTGGSAA